MTNVVFSVSTSTRSSPAFRILPSSFNQAMIYFVDLSEVGEAYLHEACLCEVHLVEVRLIWFVVVHPIPSLQMRILADR